MSHDPPATYGDLFSAEPQQWGMRGDPHLWAQLRRRLAGRPLPNNRAEIQQILEQQVGDWLGVDFDAPDLPEQLYFTELDNGGMTGG